MTRDDRADLTYFILVAILLGIVILLSGCGRVLPVDPNPDLQACVDSAVSRNQICVQVVDKIIYKGFTLPDDILSYCTEQYEADLNVCREKWDI